MKANELKVKNLVVDHNGELCLITGINETGTIRCDNGSVQSIDKITPVKITEDLLSGFGFENLVYAFDMNIEPELLLRIIVTKGGFYTQIIQEPEVSNEHASIVGLRMIEYAHELQNLWQVLTGRELDSEPARTTQNI